MSRSNGFVVLLSLLALTAFQSVIYYDQLPDPMASHFGVDGEPDAWMAKRSFFIVMGALQVFLPAFLIGIGCCCRYLPDSLINLPHKDYWLAEKRRDETLQQVEMGLVWISVITVALMIVILQLTIRANLANRHLDSTATIATIVLYLVAMLIVGVRTFGRFFTRPAENDN